MQFSFPMGYTAIVPGTIRHTSKYAVKLEQELTRRYSCVDFFYLERGTKNETIGEIESNRARLPNTLFSLLLFSFFLYRLRSKSCSKLMFASCVRYIDRACYGVCFFVFESHLFIIRAKRVSSCYIQKKTIVQRACVRLIILGFKGVVKTLLLSHATTV